MKYLFLISLLCVSSCSVLDAIGTAASVADIAKPASNGIEAELVVGTKDEQINTEVVIGDKQKTINQQAKTIENNNVSMPIIAVIVLLSAVGAIGWIAPTPSEMVNKWREKV